MPETLYQLRDIARVFGVSPSAVSNWRQRGSGPELPEPLYVTPRGLPLYTREQLEPLIAERIALLATMLDGEGEPCES